MMLQGRTLWLIGASSGIGAALAPLLAAEGAILALSARREPDLQAVADSCPGTTRPLVKPVDVGDMAALQAVYDDLKADWGKVDVLFYNAGTWAQSNVATFDAERALVQIDVVYLGLVRAVSLAMPDMIARREGDIVGMASVAGYAGIPSAAAYSSAKAAVNAFLQSIRIELRGYGVGVTTINPGFVKTPLTDRNNFPMPFKLSADEAGRRIVTALLQGRTEIHFPRRLSWPLKLITALPRPVYEWLARGLISRRGAGAS